MDRDQTPKTELNCLTSLVEQNRRVYSLIPFNKFPNNFYSIIGLFNAMGEDAVNEEDDD